MGTGEAVLIGGILVITLILNVWTRRKSDTSLLVLEKDKWDRE